MNNINQLTELISKFKYDLIKFKCIICEKNLKLSVSELECFHRYNNYTSHYRLVFQENRDVCEVVDFSYNDPPIYSFLGKTVRKKINEEYWIENNSIEGRVLNIGKKNWFNKAKDKTNIFNIINALENHLRWQVLK